MSRLRRLLITLHPARHERDIDQLIEGAYAQNRLQTLVLVLFASTALSLACLGAYGTLSYIVSLRRREVGLRLALGAARAGMLYGISSSDPVTFSSVVGIVLTVAALASFIPAARAALVEPMRILRDE